MTSPTETVREFLRARGCARHVVDGGVAGLATAWARFADEVAAGYAAGLDDYRNDCDGRQILADVLTAVAADAFARERARVAAADATVKAATAPFAASIWGTKVAATSGWGPRRNWWYFRAPVRGGDELAADLAKVH
ncbi:MAG: hypothetical protein U1E73_04495 [Planctomycetota bacterium]